jgi:hypothetical protein
MARVPNIEKERVRKVYADAMKSGAVKTTGNTVSLKRLDSLHKDSADYYNKVLRQKDYTEVYGLSLLTADSIIMQTDGDNKVIFFTDYLYITYKKEMEDKQYLVFHHESRNPVFQRSYIWLTNLQPIAIDANGNYYPPQEVFSMAYWGWEEKMANMLPIDYLPGK